MERFELLHPYVQQVGEMAVLTFHFAAYGGHGEAYRWNCTEVYRRDAGRGASPTPIGPGPVAARLDGERLP
ncbi:MAG: hypothetical protein L0Y66_10025 [Myxococcaceae bacterium]|nr:hypothetical protein [Myxococcaceae bacterium]MCI0673413.1 hypothetical protein [Myxococcaceae bacterium]